MLTTQSLMSTLRSKSCVGQHLGEFNKYIRPKEQNYDRKRSVLIWEIALRYLRSVQRLNFPENCLQLLPCFVELSGGCKISFFTKRARCLWCASRENMADIFTSCTVLCRNTRNGLLASCSVIGQKNTKIFWHQSEARTTPTVWNWSGKTLSPGAFSRAVDFSSPMFFVARLDFPSPPLSAPGSPRMEKTEKKTKSVQLQSQCLLTSTSKVKVLIWCTMDSVYKSVSFLHWT